ncbi:WYL domain-containing protein [Methylobacillus sp.]|uniref:WYL domain-containing protein n=1 Tax=Methylobacillus sp. TaxID=56818 RepID=UPI002FE297D2
MELATQIDKISFAQKQRLTFIESVAYWEGAVDRARVSETFQVSENHVTKDFRLYKEVFPGNLQYDESYRTYRPSKRFKPYIGKGSAEEYLSMLRMHAEQNHAALPLPTGVVAADAVSQPKGLLKPEILNSITRAISSKKGLSITYQSMNSDEPRPRKIWPHALVFGGTRWHARAYDEERADFVDLVLQRVLSAKPMTKGILPANLVDSEWEKIVTLEVIPKKNLTKTQAEVVAQEYGMTKKGGHWVWEIPMRECMAAYFIYLYRLDVTEDAKRRIELKSPDIAKKYLSATL